MVNRLRIDPSRPKPEFLIWVLGLWILIAASKTRATVFSGTLRNALFGLLNRGDLRRSGEFGSEKKQVFLQENEIDFEMGFGFLRWVWVFCGCILS